MISVVLVEDHTVVREGIHMLLDEHDDIQVVGVSGDGNTAVDLVARVEPDVLIVDLTLPGLSGLEVVHRVSYQSPDTAALVLSMHERRVYVVSAFQNGASGYVLKDESNEELLTAIRAVDGGEFHLCGMLDLEMAEIRKALETAPEFPTLDVLTSREREILAFVAAGDTTAEIAYEFGLSPRTIETHRRNILIKLNAKNMNEAVRWAVEHGLLARDD